MSRRFRITAAAVMTIITAAVIVFVYCSQSHFLVLKDSDTGEEYGRFRLGNDRAFSVGFVHSVNKSPVIDYYEVRDGRSIYVVKTVYYGFGAGVQTELNDGEHLTYGEDGEMIISDIDQEMRQLIYVVGTVSDHILTIDRNEISLRDLCGRNSHVCFTYD